MGSCVWRTSEKTAVSTITSTRTPPAAPSGFFLTNRPRVVQAPERGRGSAPTARSTGLTAIAHARVEHAIEHVHGQVRQDHDDRDEHDQVLDDRVVPPENRVHQEACDPGEVEHPFGHDEAPDEEGE